MRRPLCIYHGPDCADGFTAAWAVWTAIPAVELLPARYGDAPPDVTGRNVYIVDFSYRRPVLERMGEEARSILVLDHHKTAAADLAGLWADEPPPPEGVHPRRRAIFDMERSGAGLAWDYLMPAHRRPPLVNYVEDRDLWRFQEPDSRPVNAYIGSFEHTLDRWTLIDDRLINDFTQVVLGGKAILRQHDLTVKRLAASATRRMSIGGHDVPVANVPYLYFSDVGNLLAEGEVFAACYFDGPGGREFSLRSTGTGLDVSQIARAMGGGGHARAAGFRKPHGWDGDAA